MASFADRFTLKLGDAEVVGRRLTIKELRGQCAALLAGELTTDAALAAIRDHVTLKDGSAVDPEDLTEGQARQLIAELVLPKEGRGISDFIGLLS